MLYMWKCESLKYTKKYILWSTCKWYIQNYAAR